MTAFEVLKGAPLPGVGQALREHVHRPTPVADPRSLTLAETFAATAARHPQATALDAGDAHFTYAELLNAAEALAERLRGHGIGAGDRVGVRVPSGTAELYLAILGVLTAGAAYVPVDADDPEERARELWRRAGVCAVLTGGMRLELLTPGAGGPPQAAPGDDAWVIFTSGSTGAPKGVAVSHSAAVAFVEAEARLWDLSPRDRVMAGLSVSFDASCEEIWLAWRHGAALVPAPRELVRSGAELGPWLAERGVTVVSTVPSLAAIWDRASLASVRLLILGGEACPEQLGWALAREREVWNTYGPTEATVVSTAAPIRPGQPIVIGRSLAGWSTAVLAADGSVAAPGEEGELVIGGAGLGRYLDPALDAERFAPVPALGWRRAYRTGDLVRETPAGLAFLGRRDDQVKIAGRRVELGELDARLAEAPGVTAALTAVRESGGGNKLLVGYVTGDVDAAAVRAWIAERLPAGLAPLIVVLGELPRGSSGKLDRKALPWPPPSGSAPLGVVGSGPAPAAVLRGLEAWLAERWVEQLGPVPIRPGSDFFELGGSSLAAAKLASAVRERFPTVAVADVYSFRSLREQAGRLQQLGEAAGEAVAQTQRPRSRGGLQLLGSLLLLLLGAIQWVVGLLALDELVPGRLGPRIGWGWVLAGWLAFVSVPGRTGLVILARRMLLPDLAPGRYPRRGWLASRIWFVERLSERSTIDRLAGTPWALRITRLLGLRVGDGARLGTIPAATSLVSIGAGATLEGDVDVHGWWIDGDELVIGELRVGAGASIGARAVLMPGSEVGDGAEVDPGSVIDGNVPAGERWGGVPARPLGVAGEGWPEPLPAPRGRAARRWRGLFALGIALQTAVPLLAAAPGVVLVLVAVPVGSGFMAVAAEMLVMAPLLAAAFDLGVAVITALAFRGLSPLIRPGDHGESTSIGWALWLSEALMAEARGLLFPLYSTIYTRAWLRLAGLRIGRRTEISTAVGLNRLTSFGDASFAADDVVLAGTRARGGWLRVAPIEVGDRSFIGNGAILPAGGRVGDDSLVGVLTTAPVDGGEGTSWLGAPPLELPRRATVADPRRTVDPPRRLIAARAVMDLIRILLPGTISVVIGSGVFAALEALRLDLGDGAMLAAAPGLLLAAGVVAALTTAAIKWLVIGRYRSGDHPLWSFFVWRDEIINTCQEQLAGAWLLSYCIATPVMSAYLRLMGAKVGRDVWCETMTITEFDLATLGDGAAINRSSVVETHLFHDRVMQIGPATVGAGATLGPAAAMLPDTSLGDGCGVAARAVVMRGERLPARTRWHGAPVVPA